MPELRNDDPILDEQMAYYRAVAREYEDHAIPPQGIDEVVAALHAFAPTGDVLELACGPGGWTGHLLRHASRVTAVDASSEMLARAAERAGEGPVRFIQADLFDWRPQERFDVVFFGFWISHVPEQRFEAFWSLIDDCLRPHGRVFFVDDAYRPSDELMEGAASSTVLRRLNDGTRMRAVKVPYEAKPLQAQLRGLGWDIAVTQTSGLFYWGAGGRG